MTTQDSDNVKAIKALEDVEKHLQDVSARMQRGDQWVWHRDGVTLIDDLGPHGFHAATERAAKAIEDAAHLFVVYLETLGRVPPRFKAVFRQAAVLLNHVALLENQHGTEYRFVRALQSLQRMKTDFQEYFCNQSSEAVAHQQDDGEKDVLSSELCTEETEKYFVRAEKAGYMDGHKWLKSQIQLAYFCSKAYHQPRPITALEEFFEVKNLAASITQAGYAPKRDDVKKWRAAMDKAIFYD